LIDVDDLAPPDSTEEVIAAALQRVPAMLTTANQVMTVEDDDQYDDEVDRLGELEHQTVGDFMWAVDVITTAVGSAPLDTPVSHWNSWADCFQLTRGELDLVQLSAITGPASQRRYSGYLFQGKPVCIKMYRFLHTIGKVYLHSTTTLQ